MTGREILDALRCGKSGCPCAKSTRTHCPNTAGHRNGDSDPSLSITDSGGKALLHCHTGCAQGDVIAALKERGLWGTSSMPTPIRSAVGRLTATYEYRSADGEVLAEHGRFESVSGKTFGWRLPGGTWEAGLGALTITALPLYGLQRLQEDAEAAVWMVEGEKAADAAYAAGLLAVCLGGGASQQSFGNALDPLRDREVVLWPDNDEAGAAYMGRIAALLPRARYVRPVLAPKGDAYDYFASGGTVAGLLELLSEPGPVVSIPDRDAITVSVPVPAGSVRFEFTTITQSTRSLDAELRVAVDIPSKRQVPHSTRINLQSASARTDCRRELEEIYGKGAEFSWATLLATACDTTKDTWRGMDYSVDLAAVALPEARSWAVEQFAPERLATILFGMGGSAKSLVCADLALHCLYGMPWKGLATTPVESVLVVDYEDTEDEWRLRIQQLCDGYGWPFPESGYRYMPGRAIPLADQVAQLRRMVTEHNVGLVIVDSAISACGGDLLDTQAAARLINCLTDLKVSALVIAHNTKAEESKYPYGSVFWHNLVRATHYIESAQDEGSLVMDSVLYNRKANRGLRKPIPLHIAFPAEDTGPVTIDRLSRIPERLKKANLKDAVASYLNEGADDATSIANAVGYSRENVSRLIVSDPDFRFVRKDGRRALYGNAEREV